MEEIDLAIGITYLKIPASAHTSYMAASAVQFPARRAKLKYVTRVEDWT